MTPARLWFARACDMTSDPQICALADAYGGIAVLAFTEVLALAKLSGSGTVDIRYSVLARRAFLDTPEHAQVVLGGMANLCLIDVEASPMYGTKGTLATIAGWARWQLNDPSKSDPTAAERMRRYRGRKDASGNRRDRNEKRNAHLQSVPDERNGDAKVTPTETDTDNSKKESSKDVTLRAIPGGGDQDG